ncbi:hypothetical protein BH11PLA2_BH11PLA2_32060 [soil metagenome]
MTRWTIGTLSLVLAVFPALAAEPTPAPDVKIGMYQGMFRDVPPNVVAALAKPMKALLEKTVGVTGDAILLKDSEELAAALNDKKVNVGVFHGFEFAWLKAKNPNLEPLLVAMPHGGRLQACLVVPADSKVEKIADLNTDPIIVCKGTKAHCVVYLESLRKPLAANIAPPISKPTLVLDEVLGEMCVGGHPAAIVDAGALEAYKNMNPGNAKGLKVICKSEYFPYGVLAIHKDNLTPEIKSKVVSGLTNADKTAQGRPLMMLWNLKSFEEVPADYNDQITSLLKHYPAPAPKGTLEVIPVSRDKK